VGVIMMRILIAAVLLCFSCNISYAKYCVKLPTCEELGYVFAANSTRRQILCPFDTDYALYLDYCQAYGLSAKPDGDAGDYQECVETKKDGTQINSGYYRYIRCNPGYTYNSGNCIENTCDGFTSETEQINGCATTEPCQKGKDKVKYKCSACAEGYVSDNNGGCKESCAYTDTSLMTGCKSADSCTKNDVTYFSRVCTQCYTGYTLNTANGNCNQTCTYTATGLPSNCSITTGSCQREDASGTKTYYAKTCQRCKSGYKLSSGSCKKNDSNCSGWNTSLSGYQTAYDTCIGEDTGATYYKETACITDTCTPCSGYTGRYALVDNGNKCKCYNVNCGAWGEA